MTSKEGMWPLWPGSRIPSQFWFANETRFNPHAMHLIVIIRFGNSVQCSWPQPPTLYFKMKLQKCIEMPRVKIIFWCFHWPLATDSTALSCTDDQVCARKGENTHACHPKPTPPWTESDSCPLHTLNMTPKNSLFSAGPWFPMGFPLSHLSKPVKSATAMRFFSAEAAADLSPRGRCLDFSPLQRSSSGAKIWNQ